MTAAVVAVGDELLLGDTVNTNAAWLGGQLAAVGVEVVASAMVGDDLPRLAVVLQRALEDADVVLVCGGLGPTSDDITRDAVAAAAGVRIDRVPELEDELRARFKAFGYDMPPEVLRQADVPRGAAVLANPVGTAPGLRLEVRDRLMYALPGPPHELQAVAEPVLAELRERSGTVVVTRTVHTAGRGESAVAGVVERTVQVPDGVALAYLAGGGITRVRFTGSDDAVLTPLADAVAAALGDAVWGRDDDRLDEVVHRLLAARNATVAVAESLTGGLLGAALSRMPGSSATFRGSAVVYATDLKETLAGVPGPLLDTAGAVSPEVAAALAAGARERLGATYGIGATGVAGPAEQEGQPVGTVHVAVAGPDGGAVRSIRLPGDRERVRLLAVTGALDLLRRTLAVAP
ncbi:MAG: CinA family nicotinamide mononucleotide deamidase-related protein [Actinobacteria bacterium]|nr:CinA family nicotinamide mononucleotide deamidase-related protein [Actinomycetota bacterium]MCA1721141.1 CinA family nicotinamide mononucleotide deamidase-related protein [Actinomycetota bacterium]